MHVPAAKHTGLDGLLQCPHAPEDNKEEDDLEEWIDGVNGFSMWELEKVGARFGGLVRMPQSVEVLAGRHVEEDEESSKSDESSEADEGSEDEDRVSSEEGEASGAVRTVVASEVEIPRSEGAVKRDERLVVIREVLRSGKLPEDVGERERKQLARMARQYLESGGELWRKRASGRHQKVPRRDRRYELLRVAHDQMGHKGVFSTLARLQDRFWWPKMDDDVKWYVRSCHECQLRQMGQYIAPPIVPRPATLFTRVYIDTMHLPKAKGYTYLVQARCSLSSYAEYEALRSENGKNVANFIFKSIVCRWGTPIDLITDNGTAYIAAAKILSDQGVNFIRISPYNSRANGPVEWRHRDVREALMKTAAAEGVTWVDVLPQVFWAERTTVQKATGYSPYFLVHGVEPVLPFDITEVTYLSPKITGLVSTSDLLARRASALVDREAKLEKVKEKLWESRKAVVRRYLEVHGTTVRDYNFSRGDLVLYRNTRVEKEASRKSKPRYLGPMVVVRRTEGGAYVLAELDGAVSSTRFASFRVIPYFPRTHISLPDIDNLDIPTIPIDVTARDDDSGEQ